MVYDLVNGATMYERTRTRKRGKSNTFHFLSTLHWFPAKRAL
jgi:hypothetical protein